MPEAPEQTYDVAIIGAGISGLTAAALLSKAGLKVCIIELNTQPGGYLAKLEKKGYIFDTAIHWLNYCSADGVVSKVFNIIGDDYPKAKPQKKIKRFKGENFDYLLTNNPDELKDQLIADFPTEKAGIEKFFNAAKRLTPMFNNFHKYFRTSDTMNFIEMVAYSLRRLKFVIPFIKYVKYSGLEGKNRGLSKFFHSKVFYDIFSNEPDLLSCLIPIAWAYNDNYQSPPEGGSQTYAYWLAKKAESFGCQFFYKAEARKIVQKNKRCNALIYRLNNSDNKIFCEHIISTCDLRLLYEKIMPKDFVPKKTLENLKKAELYSSALLVNAFLNCPAEKLGFGEEIIAFNKNEINDDNSKSLKIRQLSVFSQSARNHSLAPVDKGSLTIIMPAYFSEHNKWNTETDDHGNILRGVEYKKLKDLYAEELLRITGEKLSVNLREHVAYYDVSTPITYWRYTMNYEGTMMGQKPGKKNVMLGVAKYKTPIKGLYISGHWAELGGGVPIALKAAYNAALLVLKERKHNAFISYINELKQQ